MQLRRAVTQEEKQYILENDSRMTIQALADSMGRNKSTVDKIRKELGLRKDDKKPWSKDEIKALKENNHLSNKELATLLNRTVSCVGAARYQHNLRMVRSCFMCEQSFVSKESGTKVCRQCNPSGKRDKKNPIVRYMHYKEGAEGRGMEFNLTGPEFWFFWQKPCTYCGSDIETIGLDRIDPSKGYELDNVTPCCSRCNEMKMADDTETWVSHMKKILQHMEKNNG